MYKKKNIKPPTFCYNSRVHYIDKTEQLITVDLGRYKPQIIIIK